MLEKWPTRIFVFDMPVARFACLAERLRGTAARIDEKVRGVAHEVMIRRPRVGNGEAWSIQENIGHLVDLEALHLARLDELKHGVTVLRGADLANPGTWAAGHNEKPLSTIMADLRRERARLIAWLEGLSATELAVSALHPRLKVQMRAIDVGVFTAEHDDYHLARIHELLTPTG
ncbi:MAG: DinB family protein [Phycisphaerales bacterium]